MLEYACILLLHTNVNHKTLLAVDILGGGGILTTSLVYLAILLWASRYLWSDIEYQIIGGLFSCFAVCTIPIATYGLLRQLNLWKSEEDFSHTQLYTAQGLRVLTILKIVTKRSSYKIIFHVGENFFPTVMLASEPKYILYYTNSSQFLSRFDVYNVFTHMLLVVHSPSKLLTYLVPPLLQLNHVIIKATTIVLGFVILYFRPFPISLVPISVAILMLLVRGSYQRVFCSLH